LAAVLRQDGVHVDAIKFPAVPVGIARLRIQLNSDHTPAQIDDLVDLLARNRDVVHHRTPARRQVASEGAPA
jgi:7-keto-8-aminopelargonate synthetase-like enzyme